MYLKGTEKIQKKGNFSMAGPNDFTWDLPYREDQDRCFFHYHMSLSQYYLPQD